MAHLRCFRRRLIAWVEPGAVRAGVEDDYHHFTVRLEHDGRSVTAVTSATIRAPWSICPGAAAPLQLLRGAALDPNALRSPDAFDRLHQCTHQLELALFAIAQAARGDSRRYDVTVTDADEANMRTAVVARDGLPVERWQLSQEMLTAPDALRGQSVRKLKPWAERLDTDRYEAVAILRRCLQVASKRPAPSLGRMTARVEGLRNACYAYQQIRIDEGIRSATHQRDFTDRPEMLLQEFR